MKEPQLIIGATRSSKKNLTDRMLLASWIAVYSTLLLGFGILKWFEGVGQKGKAPGSPAGKII